MKEKDLSKIFVDACLGKETPYTPVWMMRQAGRYLPEYMAVRAEAGNFLNLCHDPKKAAEVTIQPLDIVGVDAAILFSDILVIPDPRRFRDHAEAPEEIAVKTVPAHEHALAGNIRNIRCRRLGVLGQRVGEMQQASGNRDRPATDSDKIFTSHCDSPIEPWWTSLSEAERFG